MTCIAAISHRGRVHMAADSAVGYGQDAITCCSTPKVWVVGQLVIGVAGDLVARDAVRFRVRPPEWDGVHAHAYICRHFVPEVRAALKASHAPEADLELLIGLGGNVLHVDSAGGATCWACGYGAAGSGADVALGALHATAGSLILSPRERLTTALAAAEAHNSSVRGPFVFAPDDL